MGQPLRREQVVRGVASAKGSLGLQVVRKMPPGPMMPAAADTMTLIRRVLREGLPTTRVEREVNRWRTQNMRFLTFLTRGLKTVLLARALKLPHFHGALTLTPIFKIGTAEERRLTLGLVGVRVVTDAGVNFIVDAFQGTTELENMKFHGIGTGSTAEDQTDTALVTELTTQYTGNVRATGNLAEGASANIFHTEGTNTLDETPGAALREHGVFSQAATGGGTLLDRTVYAAITLSAGDALLSKYELTLSAGG
jgi:hypothetical protein